MKKITIVGAGLAGCEAALQFAENDWNVLLYEMRPKVMTPAHETGLFAELVCSNSLKSKLITTASGLLKEEMRLLGSKLLPIAESCQVAAGNALAIDRKLFAQKVTNKILEHPKIKFINEEYRNLEDDLTILATGPLTSDSIMESISNIISDEYLSFFDAIAPIISAESLDYTKIYRKTRYDKGEADYLNCPFSKEEYERFVIELNQGEKHKIREFENHFFEMVDFNFYENCTPVEELARRGKDTLRYGVMRPVGLENPLKNGERPYAVIQLRQENNEATAYNLVGCQTMLTYGDQKRIFRLIPGLENVEFLRYGSIHRNSFLNSPHILTQNFSLKNKPNIYISGQYSGVEGYVESIWSGLITAKIIIENLSLLPPETISGQLWRYLLTERKNFQPTNANFGLLPPLPEKIKDKKLKKQKLSARSIENLIDFLERK